MAKGIWQYFFLLSIRTFEVIVVSVVKILVTCFVSVILKDK